MDKDKRQFEQDYFSKEKSKQEYIQEGGKILKGMQTINDKGKRTMCTEATLPSSRRAS